MTTHVSVAAGLAWVTDPLDPGGAVVTCGTRRPSEAEDVQDGQVDQFVGGGVQVRTFDMQSFTLPIQFAALLAAQVAQLSEWKGRTLLLRTTDGMRYYGAYLKGSLTTNLLAGPLYDYTVDFYVVSYTDAA